MIYNLVNYCITKLPSIEIIANGWSPDSPIDSVMMKQTTGTPNHFYDRTDWTVQVMSRAKDTVIAKQNADSVYALLKNKFGLQLPSATVKGTVYSAIMTYQISPLQTPSYIAADDNNLEQWSFNLIIITT